MFREADDKMPLKKALLYVLFSVIIIWGTLFLTWLIHRAILVKRSQDPRYNIVALVQTTQGTNTLQNWQIAELLDLSCDNRQNLYMFDPKEASDKLMGHSCIQKANVRRQPPGIILVDYLLREPVAYLAEYSNVAVDKERYPFLHRPYFTPKILPELYIGANDLTFFSPLDSDEALLAFRLLDSAKKILPYRIRRIDTQNAYKKNAGMREVIVIVDEGKKERILRMNPHGFDASLATFMELHSTFEGINPSCESQIIDLRTPSIALVK